MASFEPMRPIVLGIDNPYPGEALAPDVPGSAGWNLWKLSDVPREEYMEKLDRRNLMVKWVDTECRAAGQAFRESMAPGAKVIVLGRVVKTALALPNPVIVHPCMVDGVEYRVIPHPSGRNLFYNHPANRMMIRMLLQWSIGERPTAISA